MTNVYLYIGSWYSKCGACNQNADPYELAHDMVNMEGEGCGAVFTHVAETFVNPNEPEYASRMRPDLKRTDKLVF